VIDIDNDVVMGHGVLFEHQAQVIKCAFDLEGGSSDPEKRIFTSKEQKLVRWRDELFLGRGCHAWVVMKGAP
jgi:hypothetical protein